MDQIIHVKTTLRYLGVMFLDELFLFGENQAVITFSTLLQLPLKKTHNILSYHQVHKAIALKMLPFKFVKSCDNFTNILSTNSTGPWAWTFAYLLLFCAVQPGQPHNTQEDTSQRLKVKVSDRQIIPMIYLCQIKDTFLLICCNHGDQDAHRGLLIVFIISSRQYFILWNPQSSIPWLIRVHADYRPKRI